MPRLILSSVPPLLVLRLWRLRIPSLRIADRSWRGFPNCRSCWIFVLPIDAHNRRRFGILFVILAVVALLLVRLRFEFVEHNVRIGLRHFVVRYLVYQLVIKPMVTSGGCLANGGVVSAVHRRSVMGYQTHQFVDRRRRHTGRPLSVFRQIQAAAETDMF